MILHSILMRFLAVIDINKAEIGDCIYVLLTVQNAPVFAEIKKVLPNQNAIEVWTSTWGNRTVLDKNAYWEEKEAKKNKLVRIEYNYKQWAKEYFNEETEITSRSHQVCDRQQEVNENKGSDSGNTSVQKGVKRKQKVVRKTTTRKRKTRRNTKTSRAKK